MFFFDVFMRFNVIFCIYEHILKYIFGKMLKETNVLNFTKTCFLLFSIQINGWYAVFRIEETKLVCAISRKVIFGR